MAEAKYNRLISIDVSVLELHRSHFAIAARFAGEHQLGLRANDALHLALAAEASADVFSLDIGLIKAGLALGIKASSPID